MSDDAARIEELEAKLAWAMADAVKARGEVEAACDEAEDLREQIEMLEVELCYATSATSKAQGEVHEQREEIERLRDEIESLETEFATARRECQRLRKVVATMAFMLSEKLTQRGESLED